MPQPSNLVTVTQKRYRCRHVHAAGHQCGSPALRNEEFCYFHHTTRRPRPVAGKFRHLDAGEPFELPIVEDLTSALSVAAQLLCRIASNDLDPNRAGKLLYNLQIITSILDRASRAAAKATPAPQPEPVEEVVADETHGLIAPITELSTDPPTAESRPLTADSHQPTLSPPLPKGVISTEGDASVAVVERPPHSAPAQLRPDYTHPASHDPQPPAKNRLPRCQRSRSTNRRRTL